MGRRTMLTSDNSMKEDLLTAIKLGMSDIKACDYAGISVETFYQWRRKAEADIAKGKKSIYVTFLNRVKKARADFQVKNIANIVKASNNGSWQASAWLLERRCPDEYALRKDGGEGTESRVVVSNDVPKTGKEEQ